MRTIVPAYYYEDFEVGAKFRTHSRTVTEADHTLFCALVGYHVPQFIDEEFSKNTRYGSRICPSALVMSYATASTEGLYRDGVVGVFGVQNGKFFLPVRIGDTIVTEITVIDRKPLTKSNHGAVITLDATYNQRGERVYQIEKHTIMKARP